MATKVILSDPIDSAALSRLDARQAGLRYVKDGSSGYRRLQSGKAFRYVDIDGKPLKDETQLARIRSLVIPPAWQDVWICRWENGHLQATGRDARGRKQYRYHPQWRIVRDNAKYERMLEFGLALPKLRSDLDRALALPGLPREKVLAAVVFLLHATLIRVGNREYARDNESFGMSTLRKKHVRLDGSEIRFSFRGKSGVQHSIRLQDRRLANLVKRMRELPGQDLFQYQDEEGELRAIGSADVNDYLRELSGEDYTAKDFRTWSGTVLAATALIACEPCQSDAHGKRMIVQAISDVAQKLGNTPAICRKCYVHPQVIACYTSGALHAMAKAPIPMQRTRSIAKEHALTREEMLVIHMLKTIGKMPHKKEKSGGRAKAVVMPLAA
ncbi:MAG: DNA topoisomerase IB [Oxalicibacterium faecigallinarum]|uniref:DNA topoisomerase IB n=1 Tax=Oxalicibacterium faecigallinarum TaxID=573741 RepID=UPI0028089349|nr:DNA topoisomerase IB [Oxalicibacterium faecigallinarum]MDQ7970121.1 DNA topoisomerase IB [Oxalicibacterium faecigallinarum]